MKAVGPGAAAWLARAAPRLLVAAALLLPVAGAPSLVQVLVLLALLAAAGLLGTALAGQLLPATTRLDRALAAATLGIAACVLLGVGLGHVGALTGSAFRGSLALLVIATRLPARGGQSFPGRADSGRRRAAVPGQRRWLATAMVVAAVVVSAAGLLLEIWRFRLAPPGRFAFDDTSYHLTAVATWTVHGDLRMPRFSYGDARTPFYPFASELLAWELTAPFAGGDFAARWVELPFALLTLLATVVVARRLGARPAAALLAPLLYATVHDAFPGLALAAGNDHAVAFAALSSAHAALLLVRRPGLGAGVYAGAALGLLVAIKLVGLLYAPALALLCGLALASAPRGARRAGHWSVAAAAVATATVVGGYAYLRNAVTTGNPLFPVPLGLGAWQLPGWEQFALGRADAAIGGFDAWRFPLTHTEMLGPLFRWTLLPAALLAAPLASAWAWPRRRRFVVVLLLALPGVFYLIFVHFMEDHRGVRYLFAALALAAAAVSWLVGRLRGWPRLLVALAIAGAAAAVWVARLPELLVLVPLVLGLAWWRRRSPAGRPLRRVRDAASPKLVVTACVASLLLAPIGACTHDRYAERRLAHEPAAAALSRWASGRPLRVAYVGWNQPYFFCGDRLQNTLFMPPAAPALGAMLYRWGGPAFDPYVRAPSRRAWMRNLTRLRVEWVVWESTGGAGRPERGWMAGAPDRFRRLYADGRVELWRVL